MPTKFQLSAHYIKTALNLAKTEQKNTDLPLFRKERNLLVYQPAPNQFICAYSFGVVTACGIEDKKEIAKFLRRLGRTGEEEAMIKVGTETAEEYPIVVDPDAPEAVEFDHVRLKQFSVEKMLLVAHVIAQSVAIDFLDRQVEETAQRFERIHLNLAKRGALVTTRMNVMKTIGMSGNITNFIIDRLSLLDKPDITWEDKEAEILYTNMRKMYELEDRFSTLRFKIGYIQDSSELMLDVLNSRRSEFLEIIIILLFIFDIFLYFWPK